MALVKKTMRDFALWTSASGIPHVGRAHTTCMRIFWLVIFVICMGAFAYQMVFLVQQYMAFDVLVQTQLKFEPMAFPVITVCNLNPYKVSSISKVAEMDDLMTKYIKAANKNLSESEDTFSFVPINDTMAQQARARDIMAYMVSNFSEPDRRTITYDIHDMIQSCTFNQQSCAIDQTLFQEIYDPTYGRCYVYNTTQASKRAGPRYGLRLYIKTELTEYLDTTESAGVRLTITGKNEPIYPDAFGYNAQAGFTTSFAMKYVHTTRLPDPYSNCNTQHSSEYSAETCFRQCLQDHIARRCGCVDPHFSGAKTNGTVGFCSWRQLDCVNSATRSGDGASFQARQCQCPPLCDEGVYSVTTTSSNWPSKAYQKILCNATDTDNTINVEGNGTHSCQYYRDNTMFVEIYFEALNYEMLTESEAYTLTSLISDFGGQIGLWIGVSVITFVEFLMLPCLVFSSMYKAKVQGKTIDYKSDEYDRLDNEFDRVGGSTGKPEAYGRCAKHLPPPRGPKIPSMNPYVGVLPNEYPNPPRVY